MRYTLKPETKLQRMSQSSCARLARTTTTASRARPATCSTAVARPALSGHLIYTRDCVAFYLRHAREIDGMVADFVRDTGCDCRQLRGWDERDPMARDDNNRNVLAWFAFEETARNLCNDAGIDC
jgi:hypothetical protein